MNALSSLKRSSFLSTSAALAVASSAGVQAAQAQEISQVASSNGKPSIVFCHGIWADGSCFSKVIAPLQAAGYEAISAQYALNTAQGDIDAVIRTLGRVSSPSILVGH